MSLLSVPTLSYPGWLEDKKEVERLYCEYTTPTRAEAKLKGMKNKQRLFEGDRSHPEIVALDDNTRFTYEGWENDKEQAIRIHTASTRPMEFDTFEQKFCEMQRKEEISSNRSSILVMRDLDSLVLAYPGWCEDKEEVEELYRTYATPTRAEAKLTGMRNKQLLFEGDRSHSEILILDDAQFTDEGWETDKEEAIRIHTTSTWPMHFGTFEQKLYEMKRKQTMLCNRSTISVLRDLDSFLLAYPGLLEDKKEVERLYCEYTTPTCAEAKLTGMKNKQQLLEGDRSHPEIVALDSTRFTYEGWEEDQERAEKIHTASTFSMEFGMFEQKFCEMTKKQEMHSNRASISIMRDLDSLSRPRQPSTPESNTSIEVSQSSRAVSPEPERPNEHPKTVSPDPARPKEPQRPASFEPARPQEHCVVCMEEEPSHAYIPCGHRCVCASCASAGACGSQNGELKCPLCRDSAMCVTKIFL